VSPARLQAARRPIFGARHA